jgi:protocatechuate 3,4-dioxygenase beta subunit
MYDENAPLESPHAGVTVVGRRHALRLLGGASLAAVLAACGSSDDDSASTATTSDATTGTTSSPSSTPSKSSATTSTASCDAIPEETAGPFPGDGSNGPDVLSQDGVVRRDITSSFGSASGTADGVPMTINLTVVDVNNGCRPLDGAAVYVWHCDREGRYSMYSDGASDANYLRGVQPSDANGALQFTSIFPGAYSGRWPHVHFEVYESVDAATGGGTKLATSQLALPEDACDTVYAADGYEASVRNMAQLSLDSDNIFSDGYSAQLAKAEGGVDGGYTITLTVPV